MSFGSPAIDYIEENLDLNRFLIRHSVATYFMKMSGDAMRNAGIFDGDVLVVDRAQDPKTDSIIVAELNGELTIRRLKYYKGQTWLKAENEYYPPERVLNTDNFNIWGIVTSVVRKLH